MKVTIIAGARPNFMKIAPIIHAIRRSQAEPGNIEYRLVHTGQHYDKKMSDTFFEELNIPRPDVNLGVGGGTQAEQTAGIMIAFEKELMAHPADLVLVVGDVTSTMACAIVAKKLHTRVAHVEAGIRSFDLSMPEEINRLVTDCLADYFFTTSEIANQNLEKAGIPEERIFFVGNVMIDTLLANMERLRKPSFYDDEKLESGRYLVLTLHRPSNVDDPEKLKKMIGEIVHNADNLPVVFPVHPRTAKVMESYGIQLPNLRLAEPLGYLEFNYLVKHAKAVITDSGGITEETTVMGIPCLTLRDNTERPETCTLGTNVLVGSAPENICPVLKKLFGNEWKKGTVPPLWDGRAAGRIVEILKTLDN